MSCQKEYLGAQGSKKAPNQGHQEVMVFDLVSMPTSISVSACVHTSREQAWS